MPTYYTGLDLKGFSEMSKDSKPNNFLYITFKLKININKNLVNFTV